MITTGSQGLCFEPCNPYIFFESLGDPFLNHSFVLMHFFCLVIAAGFGTTINAGAYSLDDLPLDFTGGALEEPGSLVASADVFNDQLAFNPLPSRPEDDLDLFSQIIGEVPNEQTDFEVSHIPGIGESTLSLASSGYSIEDPISLFSKDPSDPAGLWLDAKGSTVQQDTFDVNGPCRLDLFNVCCTDITYRDVFDPGRVLSEVWGCVVCRFHHFILFFDNSHFI